MADTPEAPAEAAKAPESVETPINTNTEAAQAQAPDMHGFTSEQLADMKKFFDNNGGFDGVKAKISNPEKHAETTERSPERTTEEPTSQQQQDQPQPQRMHMKMAGTISPQEFLAEQYFKSLAGEEKYSAIAKGIADGDYLKEMAAFGIQPFTQDGSIDDKRVRMYLDLKAQTVPAKPTETEPSASAAPTVSYTEVGENGIANIDQAYKIIMEPGNPAADKAEEFIKAQLNKNSGDNK